MLFLKNAVHYDSICWTELSGSINQEGMKGGIIAVVSVVLQMQETSLWLRRR